MTILIESEEQADEIYTIAAHCSNRIEFMSILKSKGIFKKSELEIAMEEYMALEMHWAGINESVEKYVEKTKNVINLQQEEIERLNREYGRK